MHKSKSLTTASALLLLLLVAARLALGASTAHADDGVWLERPLAAEAHAGILAPIGDLGLGVDYTPSPWVSIGAGAGGGDDRMSAAIAARGRLLRFGRSAVGAGAGFAIATGSESPGLGPCFNIGHCETVDWDRSYWASGDVFFEHRFAGGISLRSMLGARTNLNPDGAICRSGSDSIVSCGDQRVTKQYVGIVVGYGF